MNHKHTGTAHGRLIGRINIQDSIRLRNANRTLGMTAGYLTTRDVTNPIFLATRTQLNWENKTTNRKEEG